MVGFSAFEIYSPQMPYNLLTSGNPIYVPSSTTPSTATWSTGNAYNLFGWTDYLDIPYMSTEVGTTYSTNLGDICRFITGNNHAPAGNWRLPTNDEFLNINDYCTKVNSTSAADFRYDTAGKKTMTNGAIYTGPSYQAFFPTGVGFNYYGNYICDSLTMYYYTSTLNGSTYQTWVSFNLSSSSTDKWTSRTGYTSALFHWALHARCVRN
jgi:hypothetical protein